MSSPTTYVDGLSRSDCIYFSKLAEQAERYEDMVTYMKSIVRADQELSVQERNLFSVACKNLIGASRSSWRILSNIELKEKTHKSQESADHVMRYRKKVESELDTSCHEILDIIDTSLIPRAEGMADGGDKSESIVFYYKMVGDYNRYLAEITEDDMRTHYAGLALKAYEMAKAVAEDPEKGLASTHAIRLGLALNLSVCHYEILAEQDKACELAKTAFDSAIAELESLHEEAYKDATLIMQLLRDNLTLWTSDGEDKE